MTMEKAKEKKNAGVRINNDGNELIKGLQRFNCVAAHICDKVFVINFLLLFVLVSLFSLALNVVDCFFFIISLSALLDLN